MTRFFQPELFLPVIIGLLGACGPNASSPSDAQQTYGAPVDGTAAIPAVAVAAEADMYTSHALTVDGRIVAVREGGCALRLATEEGPPLQVVAPRSRTEACAWQVPSGQDGIVVAAGTLRVDGDTLRLTANGVQVTPLRVSPPDSSTES